MLSAEQVAVDFHGERNNAWFQYGSRMSDVGPVLPGTMLFFLSTSGSGSPFGGEHSEIGKNVNA